MHILLGLLGTAATILILLNRLADAGIDLGGVNPFLQRRRRAWRKQYKGNSAFRLEDAMEAVTLLMLAVAKCDGDITKEQKALILGLFEFEFRLSRRDAQDLLAACAYLHGDGSAIKNNINRVIRPVLAKMTADQARSAIGLVREVAEGGSDNSGERAKLVKAIEQELAVALQNDRA